jgi:hypothetical protein
MLESCQGIPATPCGSTISPAEGTSKRTTEPTSELLTSLFRHKGFEPIRRPRI